MEYYRTKADLLESVNRSRSNIRRVDRRIESGEIKFDENGYYFYKEWETDFINQLRGENIYLKNRLKELENSEWNIKALEDAHNEVSRIKELESDLEYVNSEYAKMEEKLKRYQEAFRNCYMWVKNVKRDKITRPDFKKDVLKIEWDIQWKDNQ